MERMLGWLLDNPGYNHNEILVGDWLVDLADGMGHNHNEILIGDWLVDLVDSMGHNHSEIVVDEPAAVDDDTVAAG